MVYNDRTILFDDPRSSKSPLDQIVSGSHPQQTRHAILQRAVTLTRKTSSKRRPLPDEGATQHDSNGAAKQHGRELEDGTESHGVSSSSSSGSSTDNETRQRVQDLRAARLSQIQATSDAQESLGGMSPTRSVSTTSSRSHEFILPELAEQSSHRYDSAELSNSSHYINNSFVDHPDRIAEAIRGLSLRRRQSVDTVRSSEFGEGGRWDRAWAASDDEDEDNDADNILALANINIEGGISHIFGQSIPNNSLEGTSPKPYYSTISHGQIPTIHNAPSSMQKRLPSGGRSQQPTYLDPDNLQRRDTIRSMIGDLGGDSTFSRPNQSKDNASIGQNEWNNSNQSFSSDNSQHNSHVHVWPPTPASSELGGSHEGSENSHAGQEMLQIKSSGVGKSQQAKVEYYDPSREIGEVRAEKRLPLSPSAALAQPHHDVPGRAPLHPSTKSNSTHTKDEGYSDPNKPSPSLQYAGLGEARRRAIEDHDGRESLVSDLDVETLRLDGSEDSRRDSTSTLGSFSSGLIREQRQRRSDATLMTVSEKRSSTDTIRSSSFRSATRDMQHRSWNSSQIEDENGKRKDVIRPPVRSNTGPNSISTIPTSTSDNQPLNSNNGVTFSTPRIDRNGKQSGVIVKGAIQQTAAEKSLTLAITHHETGDLSRSAYYFERSAKVEGGCVVGMCMWGMALREGWGIKRDQKKGFDWISKAATKAGEMMAEGNGRGGKSESEIKAIRSELKLSVYELGKCFCYGWGVKMDKQMSLEYFELAAKLGDADAQAEAGALLAAGKGCKKDLKKAATYYRMAESQGYDTVGLSWIHKAKYD